MPHLASLDQIADGRQGGDAYEAFLDGSVDPLSSRYGLSPALPPDAEASASVQQAAEMGAARHHLSAKEQQRIKLDRARPASSTAPGSSPPVMEAETMSASSESAAIQEARRQEAERMEAKAQKGVEAKVCLGPMCVEDLERNSIQWTATRRRWRAASGQR